jgi:hypothetical protein
MKGRESVVKNMGKKVEYNRHETDVEFHDACPNKAS